HALAHLLDGPPDCRLRCRLRLLRLRARVGGARGPHVPVCPDVLPSIGDGCPFRGERGRGAASQRETPLGPSQPPPIVVALVDDETHALPPYLSRYLCGLIGAADTSIFFGWRPSLI